MADAIPAALRGLIDDAAVFPPGNAALEDAVPAHRGYRASWYAPIVGPLLVPASRAADLNPGRSDLDIGLIVDIEPERVEAAVAALAGRARVVQFESRAALDSPDIARSWSSRVFAEIPIGDENALDAAAEYGFAPKFRTGGLVAEAFPTPEGLAGAIAGCARRGLRFKLTAGLHHAIRRRDPETGFTHHGFLNVLVASGEAASGADIDSVARQLASTDAADLAQRARTLLDWPRPLWTAYGSCSIDEPVADLIELKLLERGAAAS
ncbi:hypothetical protein [Glycomyces buryatensis]|uniref:Uncharacterized protein n=1 Tax=Glycomyces buryatensis TaxID=2570927 RepID=A0A4S8QGI4_9ACTN|nr:hypothetical protein [Glycomyces buryatensis]THV39774.1 hypothetical protein FAB82_16790 [Glycomyces buryatensis]